MDAVSMERETILVVEDARENRDLIRAYLEKEGFNVHEACDGRAFRRELDQCRPDLVLLDIELPDTDGLTLALETRERLDVGIIFVTVRDNQFDRVAALELGGDDYVTKPVDLRELLARIRSVLRRRKVSGVSGATLDCNGISLDLIRREARNGNGEPLVLTSGEFTLLAALLARRGDVLSREELLAVVTRRDNEQVSERTVDTLVRRLRKKLDWPAGGEVGIESVHGVGYRIPDC